MPEFTLEELCALRDKLILDPSYSDKEQTLMFGLLDEQIHQYRNPALAVAS